MASRESDVPPCPWCNRPTRLVWVHGHAQCEHCRTNIDPCCAGDETIPARGFGGQAASPCIGVCQLDGRTRTCVGCGRTVAEIAAWADLDEAERRAIIARLDATRPPPRDGYDG